MEIVTPKMREVPKEGLYTFDIVSMIAPMFIAGIVLDMLVATFSTRYKGRKIYRTNDSINSLSCGVMSELLKVHAKWLFMLPYTYIYKEFAIYRVPMYSVWVWILVLLGVDLAYYCAHRASHVISIGWISHATHHSSEYMNYTTALRQSMFGHFFFFVFYLPLALFFPPYLYQLHYGINIIYQFWIHSEMIGKLHPAIEFIFNTPSHHRVHHGRNPQYIDKNFAGMLIIWDRMFGTFEEEKEQVAYGLTHPLDTWDILWAQIHHIFAVINEIANARGITNKVRIAVAGPGWTLARDGVTWEQHPLPAIDWNRTRYDPYVPTKVTWYVLAQFIATSTVHFWLYIKRQFDYNYIFVMNAKFVSFRLAMVITFYIVFCLEVYGLTFNRSPYSKPLEVVRIFFTFGLSLYLMQAFLSEAVQYYAVLASGMFGGISLKMFEAIQEDWQFYDVPLHKSMD